MYVSAFRRKNTYGLHMEHDCYIVYLIIKNLRGNAGSEPLQEVLRHKSGFVLQLSGSRERGKAAAAPIVQDNRIIDRSIDGMRCVDYLACMNM